VDSVLCTFSQTAFFQNHRPLRINIFCFISYIMRPVFEDLKSLFNISRLVSRDWKNINSFIKTGICVQIASKSNTNRLKKRNNIILFEMSGTVKSHVLAQMRQSLLVFVFKNRTGIYHEAQFYFLLRLFIFSNVISKTIT